MIQNNMAIIGRLSNVRPIAGADKIVAADVCVDGVPIATVVVGVGSQNDDRIAYFDSNLKLSDAMIAENEDLKTYLAKGNRVRCIKLRGQISNGLVVELEKLRFACDLSTKEDGFAFTDIGGVHICEKYIPPIQCSQQQPGKKGRRGKVEPRMIAEQFSFHIDTSHLARNAHKLRPEMDVVITRKMHGTSAICGCNLVKAPVTAADQVVRVFKTKWLSTICDAELWKSAIKKPWKLFNRMVCTFKESWQPTCYDYIYASRTTVKNGLATGFYGTDLWSVVCKELFTGKLHQGETVYFEIVGYIPKTSTQIQKGYRYGCEPGQYKAFVYRITYTGPDGNIYELPFDQMALRCEEIGVPTVPVLYRGPLSGINQATNGESWAADTVSQLTAKYLDQTAADCDNNPDEGIVLRVNNVLGIECYKHKSPNFILRESKDKESDDYVDRDSDGDIG